MPRLSQISHLLGCAAALTALVAAPPAFFPQAAHAQKKVSQKVEVTKAPWGKLEGGQAVDLYTLRNKNGLSADIATYGATLIRLNVPDKNGAMGDVVLGFDTVGEYVKQSPYFGATIGRVGNRIAKGKFTLDGKDYTLAVNNGPNHLHGGLVGWDKHVWKAEPGKAADGSPRVTFSTVSPDGEEGYPGTVNASVTYTLTNDNVLRLDYRATTDKPTIINMTNHSYFNLAGGGGTILNQRAKIFAGHYTPVDENLIPTGQIAPVRGTPFDLTRLTPFGTHMMEIQPTDGYDHNYVLDKGYSVFGLCAEVYDPESGRVLTAKTDQPGVQLYAGLGLDGKMTGKKGVAYPKYGSFCLETQDFPDAINQPNFPSCVLRPGETYVQHTEYGFSVR